MAEETWRYVLRVDGRDIELLDGEVTLGRSRTATVRVDHESVSRTHAMLTFRKGDAVVKDLNSSNGTYVGGRRVLNETRLADGDRIQLGAAVVGFKVVAPAVPAEKTALIGSELASSAPPPALTPDGPVPAAPRAAEAIPYPDRGETEEPPLTPRPEGRRESQPPSVLPPAPPPPEPIPLDTSAEALFVDVDRKAAVLDRAAELAAAAKEAVRLSPPSTTPVALPAVPPVPPRPPQPPPLDPPAAAPAPAPRPTPPRAAPDVSRIPLHPEERPSRGTAAERAIPENVAGFLPRLAAWLVDSVILLALNLIFLSPVFLILFFRPELKSREAGADWTLALIASLSSLVIVAANFWYLVGGWAKSGRTPGKALLGLAIVRSDRRTGGGLGWRTAVVRAVGYALSSLCLCIGFLVVLFRKDKRAWHDLIADTWVVWRK